VRSGRWLSPLQQVISSEILLANTKTIQAQVEELASGKFDPTGFAIVSNLLSNRTLYYRFISRLVFTGGVLII
jgi:hypothetical protein